MPVFSVYLKNKRFHFKAPVMSMAHVTELAGTAIHTMRERVGLHLNVNDQVAKPYSPHGPIYVALTGKGRTKSSLRGAPVLTAKDLTKLRKSPGVNVLSPGGKSQNKGPIASGAVSLRISKSRKSAKFENYAAYKRALGKSGMRDLEVSGRMLGSIDIVAKTPNSITLGFTREEEHQKALGNHMIDPWFGLSPSDRQKVMAHAKSIFETLVKQIPQK